MLATSIRIMSIAMARNGSFIQNAGRLKPSNKQGKGYPGIRYGVKKGKWDFISFN